MLLVEGELEVFCSLNGIQEQGRCRMNQPLIPNGARFVLSKHARISVSIQAKTTTY